MGAALTTYEWEFGDGAVTSGDASKATVSHTYTAANTYTVKLRVVDADGNDGLTSRSLGVGVGGGNPVVVCPTTATAERDKPLSLTASGSDPGGSTALTYSWTFSDGATATGPTVQHTFTMTGPFTSSVVASTPDSRTSAPCTTQITVTPPVSFTGTWLLNPAAGSLSGCSRFSPPFPALTLSVLHTGDMLLVGPMGG
jgi:PKD repeat protein